MIRISELILCLLLALPAFATKEPDRVIQQAYEEIADFSSMREIVWDVDRHGDAWTVTLSFHRDQSGEDRWVMWTVTNSSLKSAVALVEKDVYDFPEGHERNKD